MQQQAQAYEYEANGKEDLDNHFVNSRISQKFLNFIFGIVFFTNLMINVDHGILPACTKEVKKDLNLDDANLGLLGSLVYGGLVIGSLFAMPIFNYCNTKFVLIVCLLLNSVALIMFTVTNEYYVLVLSRIFVGFFQVFFCIYFPVWVDLFADEKKKTYWLTLLLLGVPLGVILGYVATSIIVMYTDWRWTFYAQSGLIIPLAICFMFTPARYIVYSGHSNTTISHNDTSSKMTESLNIYNLSQLESRGQTRSMHPRDISIIGNSYQQSAYGKDPENSPSFALNRTNVDDRSFQLDKKNTHDPRFTNLMPTPQLEGRNDSFKMDNYHRNPAFMKQVSEKDRTYSKEQGYQGNKDKNLNLQIGKGRERSNSKVSNLTFKFRKQQEKIIKKTAKMVENYTLCQKITFLLTNFNFMMLLLAMTSVYFLTTGIQFWITDYFMTVLGQTKETAFLTFTVCALTGPILGVVIGGYIFSNIGGYNSPNAFPIAVVVMFLGASCGIPLLFMDNFYGVSAFLWGQFFFGGMCMPVLTGILLNTCPASLRTIANSIANLVYNLLGYLPAPYIYGLVYQLNGSGKSRAGMLALQIAAVLSSVFLVALFLKKRAFERTEKHKHHKKYMQSQAGAGLEYLDNDQIGPLLSQQSEESVLRRRKDIQGISSSSDELEGRDEYMMYGKDQFKTPVSDRIKLESTSVLYSKSMYPLSLGIHDDE